MNLRVLASRNGGVEIDSSSIPSDPQMFSELLKGKGTLTHATFPIKHPKNKTRASAIQWREVIFDVRCPLLMCAGWRGHRGIEWKEEWMKSTAEEKCLVWLSLNEKQGKHVVFAIEDHGFEFHHARDKNALLVLNPSPATIETAPYADLHPAAAGCVVSNDGKVLLMTEKHKYFPSDWVQWKMPGGSIDPGESIVDGCLRETYEETGVKCDFMGILAIRHVTRFWWQAADMYCICLLRPHSMDLNPDFVSEVDRCEWHSLKDVVEDMQVFPVQRAALEHCVRVLQGHSPLLVPQSCMPTHCRQDDDDDEEEEEEKQEEEEEEENDSGRQEKRQKSARCFRYVPVTKKWMDLPFEIDLPHPLASEEKVENIC